MIADTQKKTERHEGWWVKSPKNIQRFPEIFSMRTFTGASVSALIIPCFPFFWNKIYLTLEHDELWEKQVQSFSSMLEKQDMK